MGLLYLIILTCIKLHVHGLKHLFSFPVALFEECHEHYDCAGSGIECLAGYCVCQTDYHAQDGLCSEWCQSVV